MEATQCRMPPLRFGVGSVGTSRAGPKGYEHEDVASRDFWCTSYLGPWKHHVRSLFYVVLFPIFIRNPMTSDLTPSYLYSPNERDGSFFGGPFLWTP